MFQGSVTCCLPLISIGVGDLIVTSLRDVGVPVLDWNERLTADSRMYSYALFDSGLAVSRRRAEAASRAGTTTIDVRALSRSARFQRLDEHNPHIAVPRLQRVSQLLAALKHELERLGALWANLADAPYPFSGITDSLTPAREQPDSDFASLRFWRPTSVMREQHRLDKSRVQLHVACDGKTLSVECRNRPVDRVLQLEIWKGHRMARVPLAADMLSLDFSSLPMLASRGPRLTIHEDDDDGFQLNASDMRMTA